MDHVISLLGGGLCAIALLRATAQGVGSWHRSRRRRAEIEAARQRFVERVTSVARAARAEGQRFAAWQGTRPLRVSAIVDETPTIRSFYLTDPDSRPLPAHEPGQYLTLHLPIDGEHRPPTVRCYSLSDRARPEYYRLTIKRCDAPAGRGSTYLHTHMAVGDKLQVAAPRGGFFLDPRERGPVVLVAGGIGVTPLLSMLLTLQHAGDTRPVVFVYGVRNGADAAFRNTLADVAANHAMLRLEVAYSQPLASDRAGIDYQHAGRVTPELLKRISPTGNPHYYLCGPGEMLAQLVAGLHAAQVPDSRIHYEAFGPASIPRRGARLASQAVSLAKSCKSLTFTGGESSLLELVESAQVPLASGCRAGNCGECLVKVNQGTVTTTKSAGCEIPPGHCLACISVPTSAVELEI